MGSLPSHTGVQNEYACDGRAELKGWHNAAISPGQWTNGYKTLPCILTQLAAPLTTAVGRRWPCWHTWQSKEASTYPLEC